MVKIRAASRLVVALVIIAIVFGVKPAGLMEVAVMATGLAVGLFGCWVALDQLILPESIARRIKKEDALLANQFVGNVNEPSDSKKQTNF